MVHKHFAIIKNTSEGYFLHIIAKKMSLPPKYIC